MMLSVIVSIYNRLDFLYLVCLGLSKQTYTDFEVIISEDRDSPETIKFLEQIRKEFQFKIKHVNQEDIGFRKTRILNKAIIVAEGEYLVFLDGDCIPHHRLLESYIKYLTPDSVCIGRRCYLDKKLSDTILRTEKLYAINPINLLLHAKRLGTAFYTPYMGLGKPSRKIIGCNWAISRKSLLDINGFDEDYTQAGRGEDFDVDWRLRRNPSIKFLNIKHEVITYHLYHSSNYSQEATNWVSALMEEKIKLGHTICKNGIKKLD